MEKLSPNVQQLYSWLQQGNALEQCTHAGRSIGLIRTVGSGAPEVIKAAFNTLCQYGLLKETEFFEFGMRWSRFSAKASSVSEALHG